MKVAEFFKQVWKTVSPFLCDHRWKFERNLHGDEINASGGKRSILICKKCKKVHYSKNYDMFG